jgi:dTDP-4-dehydrorhamnose reductase
MSMRIAVTGRHGQVARALTEAGPQLGVEVVLLGRPELDLAAPETIGRAIAGAAPNFLVNAAAYTAVDQAEREPEKANAINATGAGAVAASGRALGVLSSTFPSIMSSMDLKPRPFRLLDYPTAARRPTNSRLDCSKLARVHRIELPSWRSSLRSCLERLSSEVDQALRS